MLILNLFCNILLIHLTTKYLTIQLIMHFTNQFNFVTFRKCDASVLCPVKKGPNREAGADEARSFVTDTVDVFIFTNCEVTS